MISKKVSQIDETTSLEANRGGIKAVAGYEPVDYDGDEYWFITYHHGDMPAHTSDTYNSYEELEAGMRSFVKDLRKWS